MTASTNVLRGPAARAGRRRAQAVPQLHAVPTIGRSSGAPEPKAPVPYYVPGGRVAVTVHPPKRERGDGPLTRDCYWRIRPGRWTGLKETTDPTWSGANAAAERMVGQVVSGVGDTPDTTLKDAIAEYAEKRTHGIPAGGRNRRRETPHKVKPWSGRYGQASQTRLDALGKALGTTKCGQLSYKALADFIKSRPSYNAEFEMLKTVKALTRWLHQHGYVLPAQALYTQLEAYELVHVDTGGRLGAHTDSSIEAVGGASAWYVTDGEVPDHAAVHAAAAAMPRQTRSKRSIWYLELMVLIAAYVGLRLGELLALTCDDITEVTRPARIGEPTHELAIEIRRQHTEFNGAQIEDTKGRRTRRSLVPVVTPVANYPLTAQLRRRVAEAQAERAAGTNPAGLLFPSANGRSMFWRSNLRQRFWYPALAIAKWAVATPEQQRRHILREQIRGQQDAVDAEATKPSRYLWTFHSLRHVAARYWVFEVKDSDGRPLPLTWISQHLGHASTAVTDLVYVGGQRRD